MIGRADQAEQIDVSVLLITYNHARFIRRAFESVRAQRTSYRFEIIISEDASTDGTREIVELFARENDQVKLILSVQNLASNETVRRAIQAARGRYICLLDGDDFWTAEDKIHRQASLLDQNPDVSACFYDALIVHGDDAEPTGERWSPLEQKVGVQWKSLWDGNPYATCAAMLRKSALGRLGPWYDALFPVTDWPLYLLCAEQGHLIFVDEPVGAYRLHEAGAVSLLAERRKLQLTARFYARIGRADGGRWRTEAQRGACRYFEGMARDYERRREPRLARQSRFLAVTSGGFWPRQAARLLWRSFA